MIVNLSDKFVAACAPVIDTSYNTCGTVTKSTIDHLSVTDLNALFTPGGLFADLDAWFFHSIEMKACGVKRNTWYNWIMANADRTNFRNALNPGIKAVKGPSLLHPWIMGRQETVVNRDHWKMENSIRIADYTVNTPGTVLGTMTAGPLTSTAGGTAVIRITSRHNIPMDVNWFRVREVLHIFTLIGAVAQLGNWRVIAAAVDTSNTYIDVLVVSENAASAEPFFEVATVGASAKKGLIIPGINNVNDFERWCQNLPTLNPTKMVPFWYQSRRHTRCVDQEYLEVYKRLLVANPAFKQFGDLDLAERNRQDEAETQKRFVNAFFFQKPISTNQTLTLWESLENISTITEVDLKPGLGGKLQAKRANWIGVKEQLRLCDRVKDLNGNPLNLIEFFQTNYDIYRFRKSQGREVKGIDWFTNSPYRDAFRASMMTYYKEFYKDQLRFTVEVGMESELGFMWDRYRVGFPAGIDINIISDEFFDDWRDEHFNIAASGANETLGNMLLALDIGKPGSGTIYYAMITSNRKVFRSARIEELARLDETFRCVMETRQQEVTLTSETGTVVVECPRNSLWIENIGTQPPITTGKTLNPTYENLY